MCPTEQTCASPHQWWETQKLPLRLIPPCLRGLVFIWLVGFFHRNWFCGVAGFLCHSKVLWNISSQSRCWCPSFDKTFILGLSFHACLVSGVFAIDFGKRGTTIHFFPSHMCTCSTTHLSQLQAHERSDEMQLQNEAGFKNKQTNATKENMFDFLSFSISCSWLFLESLFAQQEIFTWHHCHTLHNNLFSTNTNCLGFSKLYSHETFLFPYMLWKVLYFFWNHNGKNRFTALEFILTCSETAWISWHSDM